MFRLTSIIGVFIILLSYTFVPINIVASEMTKDDITTYGTIVSEPETNPLESTSEYSIEEIDDSISQYDSGNNVNTSSFYYDEVKIEKNSGTHVINYNNENAVIEYNSETNEIINKYDLYSAPSIDTLEGEEEYFAVENGVITSASEANVITIGGAEKINYIYPTIEDAYNETNGVTIDGGASTGSYSESIEYNGNIYVYTTISGYSGYMPIETVQIIPSYFDMNTSYYYADNGVWYFANAIDPLVSDEYMIMPISDGPEWAVEGVKYYSDDTETFTTDEYMSPSTYTDYQNSAYFQNLSLRSSSNYNATELKSFLSHKGKSASEYYNSTQAFIDTQEEFGINALLLFSMANLEGAYGTSSYSQQCNNFFGRGAFDSNPDNACAGRQFPQPEDGILAQGIFLSVNFLDQADWRYEGSYVGSKGGGLNVHYASDSTWGQKIGSLAYECDQYLGGKDNNYYRIVQINGDVPVYTTSSLETQVKAQGAYTCNEDKSKCVDQDNPNSYVNYYIGKQTDMPVKVVVTGETDTAYEIQVETGKNQGNSGYVTWTYAETGNYPNYEGNNHGAQNQPDENYVSSGYLNFANDYNSMNANQFWIPKSYNGHATTTVVANNPIHNTDTTPGPPIYGECTNVDADYIDESGNRVVEKSASDASKICSTTYYGTSSNVKNYHEQTFVNGNKTLDMMYTYYSNGQIQSKEYTEWDYTTFAKKSYYIDQRYSNGQISSSSKYNYYSNGKVSSNLFQKYTSTGLRTDYDENKYYNTGVKSYEKHYNYYSNGKISYKEQKWYYSNGKCSHNIFERYSSEGLKTDYDENKYYDTGTKSYERHYTYYSNGRVSYKFQKWYYEDGKCSHNVYERFNNDGLRTDYDENKYYSSGKKSFEVHYVYYSNGNIKNKTQKWYYENGKCSHNKFEDFYSNKKRDEYNENYYYETGVKKSYLTYDYSSGEVISKKYYQYNSNGTIKNKSIVNY